jgi:hypothetical protein
VVQEESIERQGSFFVEEWAHAPGMEVLPSGLSKTNRCNHSVYASNLYGRVNPIKYSYRAVGEVLRPQTLPGNLHTKGALRKRRGPNGQRVRLSVLGGLFLCLSPTASIHKRTRQWIAKT